MTAQQTYTLGEANQYFAVNYNNQAWELLERKEKTDEENGRLIHLAHASLLHWSQSPSCTPANLQRGQYLIAIAYAHVQRKEPALVHAQICKALTAENQNGSKDFDFAYASLAMAVALGLNGQEKEAARYLEEATHLGENIQNKEDKRIFVEDLKALIDF